MRKAIKDEYGDEYWCRPDTGGPSHEEMEFCTKWRMGVALHPDNSYDAMTDGFIEEHKVGEVSSDDLQTSLTTVYTETILGRKRGEPILDLHKFMDWRLNLPWVFMGMEGRPVCVTDGWDFDWDGDHCHTTLSDKFIAAGTLQIELNFNFSKSRLMKDLKFLVDEWKDKYETMFKQIVFGDFCEERDIHSFPVDEATMAEFKKIHKRKLKGRKQKYEKKYHFDNFDLYLEVYDLRQEGESWAQIAEEMTSRHKERKTGFSVQDARNYYNAAVEIIKQGVDLYVKKV
jgi:hypothetical protein